MPEGDGSAAVEPIEAADVTLEKIPEIEGEEYIEASFKVRLRWSSIQQILAAVAGE